MFRRVSIAVAFIFFATTTRADDGQKVQSKVQKVTVFLHGAQVSRTAQVNISPGTYDLVFDGLSPNLEVQSIQVHAAGDFSILSVKTGLNYLDAEAADREKQVGELKLKLKAVTDKINLQDNLLVVYQTEEAVLTKNQFVRPENQNLDVAKLKQALDFQTERLTQLKSKTYVVRNLMYDLEEEQKSIEKQIAALSVDKSVASAKVIVTVSSKTTLQSAFVISYFIYNASWYPSYDIRAKDVKSPLSIAYKANVSQKSGEEWKNVKLTLSTGSPSLNNIKPELGPNYLNFENRYRGGSGSVSEVVSGYAANKATMGYTVPVEVSMVENQTNVEFNIANPYSVTNDGKSCQVEINNVTVDASYRYYAAPKLNANVFLVAQVNDWSKYNLLSGEAGIYFEDTYVGKSQIDTRTMNDTLNLSLEIDKGILVKRVPEKIFTEKQVFGTAKKETRNWVIEVKNRKNQPVSLLIEDQVPVSTNKEIEIETQETSGAKPDAATGKVSWNFVLNSQEGKKLRLKYQVKYPKDQSVIVQ
ncbi:DUF4139 domain-containing protein [Mucilaginibacter celer]|nr:DUF4139 domain-containing protein [Mucilaginibacter celer]